MLSSWLTSYLYLQDPVSKSNHIHQYQGLGHEYIIKRDIQSDLKQKEITKKQTLKNV